MEKVILKFNIIAEEQQEIELPFSNIFLKAGIQFSEKINSQYQREEIKLWFSCDKNSTMVKRKVVIVATGVKFDDENLLYLDSVIMAHGNLVFHIFIEKA